MNTEIKVLIDSVQKVKEFCQACSKHKGNVEVYSGHYIVDGKSIMGLYSLDLTKPVTAVFDGYVPPDVVSVVNKFAVRN